MLIVGLASACSAMESSSNQNNQVSVQDCTLAAVNSDYVSTSISLLYGDGTVCMDHVIHSGSKTPGLATALSGDVSVPSSPHPDGLLVLIDRYPNAAITLVDPASGEVQHQFSVSTGFASNPHDVWFSDTNRMFVSRSETNRTPTGSLEDWDEGGDILVVNVETAGIEGRIDLRPFADEQDGEMLDPRPDRLIPLHGLLWTNLRHLSPDFQTAGVGKLVGIDPNAQSIVGQVELSGLENCTGIQAEEDGLWLVCTGLFAATSAEQVAVSGVVHVDVGDPSAPTVDWSLSAKDIANQPLGFSLAALSSQRAVFVSLGSLEGKGGKDRLVLVDRQENSVTDLGFESGAYTLGHVHWNQQSQHLLVLNSGAQDPGIQRLSRDESGSWSVISTVSSNPTVGLPPVGVGALR